MAYGRIALPFVQQQRQGVVSSSFFNILRIKSKFHYVKSSERWEINESSILHGCSLERAP